MKPSYKGFEAKRSNGFVELPPAGAYVAEIKNVRFIEANFSENRERDVIELMMEIAEGEYAGRYMACYQDQKERYGDNTKYKGVFRLVSPKEDDEDWRKRTFEGNLWCVEQSNPGYTWDWDEKKLKGKKVGISVRNRLYVYDDKERSTTEIGRFETVDDVRNGKVKPMKDRDQRGNISAGSTDSTDGNGFTDVSSTSVDVPW
jgi:hypothetical protein